jgi:hypothetical protein
MANDFTSIMPKILARGLVSLREFCMMPLLVNGDYSADAAKFGATIDVPVPTGQTATDVTPAAVPPTPASKTPTIVQIPLNKWKKTEFHLTDKELGEIDRSQSFYPMQASEAMRSLANQVNADIFAEYKGVYGYVGTAATTPFVSTVAGATDLRKKLNQQICPLTTRRAVMDFDAGANALALAAFSNFEQTGDPAVKIEGRMGRKYGFDWYEDHVVPTHTKVAAGTFLLDDTVARAVGLKTLHMDGATTAPAAGDVFTIAGDTQTYVVVSATALVGTDTDVTFEPGLKVAIPAADGNEAVTFKATHVVNLGFHRDAFAFANRPYADLNVPGMVSRTQLTDTVTGLSVSLELLREYHQWVWEFSILYGTKLVRPEFAARLAG